MVIISLISNTILFFEKLTVCFLKISCFSFGLKALLMVFRIMSLVGRLLSKLRKSSCNQCTLSYNYIQSRNLQFEASSDLAKSQLKQGFNLKEDFLTEQEEQEILGEVNHRFMRRKYNKGHWDGAIVLS